MNDHDDSDLDAALQLHLRADSEPDDAGFSLRVMAALPQRIAPQRLRRARWIRRARWTAISVAACGVALLLSRPEAALDLPQAAAAAALTGLLLFWAIPNRWSRG